MTENIKFQTETSKILQIVVNSLYSEKEIFLRELISNASDALDKLRYAAITHPGLASKNGEPKIIIKIEPKNNLLVIKDNGIGMNKEDLINNLGTIAKSGSFDFVKNLTGDAKKDIELIGQFGVGFYSCFIVAKKLDVLTKKAAEDKIVKQYSDHISYPIKLLNDGVEETLNSSSALWTRNKAEITQKEYKEFYQYLSHNFDEPWDTLHFKAEGSIEYTALLFIPSARPFNMFTPNQKKGLKLYVSKVFISDEIEDILPNYLRFVRGFIDSPDLQLNVSREMLQNSSVINKMKKGMVRRILDELKKKSENKEDYHKFIEAFGTVLKEGIYEDFEKAPEIAGLCRFNTLLLEEKISLDDYIVKMKPEQKAIYYLTGNNLVCLKNNPQIEAFVNANIDVLLLDEPVDEFWCQNLTKYKDIPLKSVLNAEEDLENLIMNKKNKPKIKKEDVNALILKLKDIYKTQVKDVIVSYKLVKSPVCITSKLAEFLLILKK
jgi:molecular chaperone HtpG